MRFSAFFTSASARFTALAPSMLFCKITWAKSTAFAKQASGSSFESHKGLKPPMASASRQSSPVLSFRSSGCTKFSSKRRA